VNNIPSGNIPLVSSGMGVNFSSFRGLIPGAMEDLNVLNPMGIFRAFEDGASPECQKITMETIDINNNSRSESHYVTTSDIKSMDPCWFTKNKNTNPIKLSSVCSDLKRPKAIREKLKAKKSSNKKYRSNS
jgi:hypothetical protein